MGGCFGCFRKANEPAEVIDEDVGEPQGKGTPEGFETQRLTAVASDQSGTNEKSCPKPNTTTKTENVELLVQSGETLATGEGEPMKCKDAGQEPIKIKNDGQEPILDKATDKPLNAEVAKAAHLPTEVEATVEIQADVETAEVQLPPGADKEEGKDSGKQDEAVLLGEVSAVAKLGRKVKEDLASKDGELLEANDAPAKAFQRQPAESVEKSLQTSEDVEVSIDCFENVEEEASDVAIETALKADVTIVKDADVVESENDSGGQSVARETAALPTKSCDDVSCVKNIHISLTCSRAEDEPQCKLETSVNRNETTAEEPQDKASDGRVSSEPQENGADEQSKEDDVIARVPGKEVAAETNDNDVDDTGKDGDKNDEKLDDEG